MWDTDPRLQARLHPELVDPAAATAGAGSGAGAGGK